MKQLIINGIPIEIEKKRIKNMYLRILPPEGRVHISAPYKMSEDYIRSFVLSKLDWIEKQQQKIQQRMVQRDLEYVTGEKVAIWGRELYLTVVSNSMQNAVEIVGDRIVLYAKGESTVEQRAKILDGWYRKSLQQVIPSLILKWETVIGVKSSGFTIRDMKTRWGTCNIRTANITLNLQLAKKPPICLEYVIVHELVHLLERSHNSIFKGYMDMFLPEWRRIKKELNGFHS